MLIEFVNAAGSPVWINLDHVVCLYGEGSGTVIQTTEPPMYENGVVCLRHIRGDPTISPCR